MFTFLISNLNGKYWVVDKEFFGNVYYNDRLRPFIVVMYGVGFTSNLRLDCSDEFLKLLVNSYFEVSPSENGSADHDNE